MVLLAIEVVRIVFGPFICIGVPNLAINLGQKPDASQRPPKRPYLGQDGGGKGSKQV